LLIISLDLIGWEDQLRRILCNDEKWNSACRKAFLIPKVSAELLPKRVYKNQSNLTENAGIHCPVPHFESEKWHFEHKFGLLGFEL
jgi:hypothetical protein